MSIGNSKIISSAFVGKPARPFLQVKCPRVRAGLPPCHTTVVATLHTGAAPVESLCSDRSDWRVIGRVDDEAQHGVCWA
ncbi:MAG: hypothetical protein IKA48_00915 [Fibrobacter sp.]|nr:hypothetical protein [Fibrobacter sp.]